MEALNSLFQNFFQVLTGPPVRKETGRVALYRYPVLLVAGLLLLGFGMGEYLVLPYDYLLISLAIMLFTALLWYRIPWVFLMSFAVFWLLAGIGLFVLVYQIPMTRFLSLEGTSITVEGFLEREGTRLYLRGIKGFPGYAPSLLVRESRSFRIDQTEVPVRMSGRYRSILSCTNPGVTDLFDFWWKRRVFGEITVDSLMVLEDRSFVRSALLFVQQSRERYFAGWEAELGSAYPLFAALVWGERGEAFYQQAEVLRRSGIYHAFCVSGLHMALFGSLVLIFFQMYAPLKKFSWAPAIIFSFGYLVFCGFSPSAFRAWLMFSLFLAGRRLGRNSTGFNLLGLAFLILFFLRPETVFHSGAQLSFTATAGIFLTADGAARWSSRGCGFLRYLKATWVVTLGVFATSLPVLIFHGYSFSSLAFLGNLLLMPVMQVTIGLTFLGSILGGVASFRLVFLPLIRELLNLVLWLAAWFAANIPHIYWEFSSKIRQSDGLVLWVLVLASLFLLTWWKKPARVLITLFGVLVTLCFLVAFRPAPPFEFWVLDVGQGLGTSVLYGDRAVVFDNGGIIRNYGNIGSSVFNPFLRYQGIEAIEAIFITHPHLDHQAGTRPLMEEFPVDLVYYRKNGSPVEGYNILPIDDPARFSFDHRILVEVYPVYGPKVNDQALVFRILLPGFSILVSGDIEEEGMRQLFRYGNHNLISDVLVMPHHGHYTSTLRDLLVASQSSFAIISVGDNRYGHPDPRTLALLDELGITAFITDRDGGIRIVPGKNGWRLEAFGKRAIRSVD